MKNFHTSIKRFSCNPTTLNCSYTCKTKNQLNSHKKNIHNIGVNWIACEKCEYKAKRQYDLKIHMKKIHGLKPPRQPNRVYKPGYVKPRFEKQRFERVEDSVVDEL